MKKLLSILLCLVLISSAFYGCSSKKTDENINDINIKITYDSCYSSINESSIRAYETVANAIINGEKEALFNISMLDDVNSLLNTGFPLIALTDKIEVNEAKNGVNISYKNEINEHKKLVNEFNNKITEILNECKLGSVSNDVFLLNAYTYVATHVTYDNTILTSYDTIMQSKGISASASNMFEYLLRQGDVTAYHMVGKDAGNNPYFWTRVIIDNKFYNFDPFAESARRSGKGLTYFGMNDDEIVQTGTKKSFTYTNNEEPEKSDDTRFNALRSSSSYTVINNSTIHATLYDGKTIDVDI